MYEQMMHETSIDRNELCAGLPPVWPEPLLETIAARHETSGRRLVVLDDDPTGGQTLHGTPVLTRWSAELLAEELAQSSAFFVLANTRALTPDEARTTVSEIARNLVAASKLSGREFTACVRGDSTLRGHFPIEADAVTQAVLAADGASSERPLYIVAPYFAEGGRFTAGDVQYVLQGEMLVPAAQTEFAHDPSFGYSTSHLPSWVQEKTAGRVRAGEVVSVSIEDLRIGGPAVVAAKLSALAPGTVVVVNAADDRDVEVLSQALLDIEAQGRRCVYTTAASFVRVRAGIPRRPLLQPHEMVVAASRTGGLLVVGSYVERSSQQLAAVLAMPDVAGVELRVDEVLAGRAGAEVDRAAGEVNALLAAGRDAVLYTSRGLRAGSSADESTAIGMQVRTAICKTIERLSVQPRYQVVKGGATASDVATRALGVQRAVVAGQLLPGVPVWRLGPESRLPGTHYVIFPGNVGGPDSVAEVLRSLSHSRYRGTEEQGTSANVDIRPQSQGG